MKKTKSPKPFFAHLILLLFLFSNSQQTTSKNIKTETRTRKLVDGFQFRNENFYDSRTGQMRAFLEDLRNETHETDQQIIIKTNLDPDNTATTGNANKIEDLRRILPNFDQPVINSNVLITARNYHNNLKQKFDYFNLNIFSEDPNLFLGDHNAYYLIIKKRGLIFYYLSRIVLYSLIVYLIFIFVIRDFQKRDVDISDPTINKKTKKMLQWQTGLVVSILVLSFSLFYFINKPRNEMNNVFSDLIFSFRDINLKINQIVTRNEYLNTKKIRVPSQPKKLFTVQNKLIEGLATSESDIQTVNQFIRSFGQQKHVTEYLPAIVLSIVGICLMAIQAASKKTRFPKMQLAILILSAVSLSYLLSSLDKYFTGFSGINDFCLSILRYGKNPVLSYQGYGVTKFLGCSVENVVFQQLYVNTVAQNAALNIFNNELRIAGRETVLTPDQAVKMTNYLRSLDASNENLDNFSNVLEKNAETIKDLLALNGCNGVRTWIDVAQKDLCLVASREIMDTMVVYFIICFFLIVLIFLSKIIMTKYLQMQKKRKVDDFLLQSDHYGNKFVND